MTEQDKELIINLWNNGLNINSIAKMLPYPLKEARAAVKELKDSGVLTAENRRKDCKQLILNAYHEGMTNPYEIANKYGYTIGTVKCVLGNAKLQRQRPLHNYVKRKPTPITALNQQTQQIIAELKNGTQCSKIAKQYGVSRQYVWVVNNKYVR